MNRLLAGALAFLVSAAAWSADHRIAVGNDEAIITDICLYDSTDGVNRIENVDSEDAGLKITLARPPGGGATLVYDAVGEIEPITTLGTWAAPTANNVRFEPDPLNGCYELHFAADTFETAGLYTLTVEDTSSPTFYDDDFPIRAEGATFFGLVNGSECLLTSLSAGAIFVDDACTGGGINTAPTATQVTVDGYTNNDVAIGSAVLIKGGTEAGVATVCDFDGGTLDYTTNNDCTTPAGFAWTVQAADDLYIYAGASGERLAALAQQIADILNDTGTAGVLLSGTPSVNAAQISGDQTAADNLEAFFDGNGYAAANSTVGTVTTLTGHTPQTGDSFSVVNSLFDSKIQAVGTIATYTDQQNFTVTGGPTDNRGAAGYAIVIVDQTDPNQKSRGCVSNYAIPGGDVDLVFNPSANFTFAVGDTVQFLTDWCN